MVGIVITIKDAYVSHDVISCKAKDWEAIVHLAREAVLVYKLINELV